MTTFTLESADLLPRLDTQDSSLPSYWRRQPTLLSGQVHGNPLTANPAVFRSWCQEPASVRIYMLADEIGLGKARALKLTRAADALQLLDEAEDSGVSITVLINNAQAVSGEICQLRKQLGIALPWREDDVVATYSHEGAGIGFHVGHEDGFIVQLAGARRWRVWAPSAVPAQYQLAVLGDPRCRTLESPSRTSESPLVDVVTQAGDALHVPALFPHEGVTLDGPSVSLSVAWLGLNRFRLAQRAGLLDVAPESPDSPADTVALFGLLPDLGPRGRRDLATSLAADLLTLTSQSADPATITAALTSALGAS